MRPACGDANIGEVLPQPIRRSVVAGAWYPGSLRPLADAVDLYLSEVPSSAGVELCPASSDTGSAIGLIAPHAGLRYSGPVAACSYRAVAHRAFDLAVLLGPSHYVAFRGAAVWPKGAFETPLGPVRVAEAESEALVEACRLVREYPSAHQREHSLELQLPFIRRVLPTVPIVPIVMGDQDEETVVELAAGLVSILEGRHVLLVASSDLSHFHDTDTAARLDAVVGRCVESLDVDGLLLALRRFPGHACGGGAIACVLRTARVLGAAQARVLRRSDSGEISGDRESVVGYMAAIVANLQSPGL
jgi:MEMO1 family protein